MFQFFKKKEKGHKLGSPVQGKAVSLSQVNDPTFAEEMLGRGIAIKPANGKIVSPADGTVDMVFDTGHAFTMTTEFQAEVLVHVGLDTVNMKGEGFVSHVEAGQTVKKGDLILTADLNKIKEAGFDDIVSMVVCNTPDFESVEGVEGEVSFGDEVVSLGEKK